MLLGRKYRSAKRKTYRALSKATYKISRKLREMEIRNSHLYLPVDDMQTAGALRPNSSLDKYTIVAETISEKLGDGHGLSVLDLGCNEGYFSLKLASKGMWVAGIDGDPEALGVARFLQERFSINKASFYEILTNKEDVQQLPNFDVVIFLSVFQKWCGQYGFEEAIQMLEIIWSKSNQLMFFEMPDSLESEEAFKKVMPNMGNTKLECRLYIQDMLGSLSSSSVTWIADYPMEYHPEHRSLFSISRTVGEP